jgi:hypothetical protein
MGGACGTSGENRIASKLLVGEPERTRPLGRPRRRRLDHIKMEI